MIGQLEIRNPYVNEVPEELMRGFEAFRIDPKWQWVLVVDGKVKAQMLCAPIHGLLGILKITSLSDVPNAWMVRFLRGVLAEARNEGMIAYITFLLDDKEAEVKLMRIVQRSGGMLKPVTGAWAVGSTEVKY